MIRFRTFFAVGLLLGLSACGSGHEHDAARAADAGLADTRPADADVRRDSLEEAAHDAGHPEVCDAALVTTDAALDHEDDDSDDLGPIIPKPDDDCPTFTTGKQPIMGFYTDILAGEPRPTKGPLLFVWHGTGGNGTLALSKLPQSIRDDISAQGGLIIAPTDNGEMRVGYSPNGVWYEISDLEYADHIVGCAVRHHNIDPRRIYVTGCSAGGLMASAMAVKRSGYVAGAFPNSGGLVKTTTVSFQDTPYVPSVLTMHGGEEDTVIVSFEQTSAIFLDLIQSEGGFAIDCNHEGGHCDAPDELNEFAWSVMKAHPYGTKPSPYANGLPANAPDYCVIW